MQAFTVFCCKEIANTNDHPFLHRLSSERTGVRPMTEQSVEEDGNAYELM